MDSSRALSSVSSRQRYHTTRQTQPAGGRSACVSECLAIQLLFTSEPRLEMASIRLSPRVHFEIASALSAQSRAGPHHQNGAECPVRTDPLGLSAQSWPSPGPPAGTQSPVPPKDAGHVASPQSRAGLCVTWLSHLTSTQTTTEDSWNATTGPR